MSDEQNSTGSDGEEYSEESGETNQEDRFKNLQSEMDRKLGNTNSKIDELSAQNAALIQAISEQNQSRKEPFPGESESLGDKLYTDPDAAIQDIVTKVTEQTLGTISKSQQEENRKAQVLGDLTRAYPELNDESHAMYKETIEIFKKMSPEDRNNPISYRLAAQEAAINLDIKPASKRANSEGFTMSGSGNRGTGKKEVKLDDTTLRIANAMGLNVKDSKVLENLKKHSQRNFNKYE